MEFINLAKSQMDSDEQVYLQHPFFREYLSEFNSNDNFQKNVKEMLVNYTPNEVEEVITFLETATSKALDNINNVLQTDYDIGVVVFLGDCSYDSHGILIDGKPYVFFDLFAIIPRMDIYNFEIFLTHELIHSIHYHVNPAFYRKNFNSVEENFLKLIFAEGIATQLSGVLNNNVNDQIFWFGFLESKKLELWIKNCSLMKREIGREISEASQTDVFDHALYNRLFGIEDFRFLENYRLGYYYGAKIVENALNDKSISEVLRLDFYEAKKCIYDYF